MEETSVQIVKRLRKQLREILKIALDEHPEFGHLDDLDARIEVARVARKALK